jgi:N-methylhydantoinase B
MTSAAEQGGRAVTTPIETATGAGYDPITFSVILNRFQSVANEMTLTLEHSAWTSILALARDFSCAIYDAVPRQIAMYDALPIHTTSQHIVLSEIARTFDGRIDEGDVFACNDPFRGNTHIGDLVTACPVFVENRHLFWTVTKGHQMDTGAFVPSSVTASARNVWQEGLTIPPIKLYERGAAREDVIDLYLSNMRYRDLLQGDLLAQLGSIEKGRERLVELCAEFGTGEVMRYVDAIIDYADRRMADEIRAMPDGTYEGEGWIDSDGVDRVDIPIKVAVTIAGDRVAVDYTGSGEQAAGGMNGSYATSQAAAGIPFMYYIDPEIPHNHGCISHISVYAPEGTICNARYPASTSVATIVPSDMMHDAINRAMASAIPEKIAAGGPRCANIPQFSGIDEGTGEPWGAMLFNDGGGQGASNGTDGWPLLQNLAGFGGLKSLSVEQIELLYPLFVHEMEIEQDSMGAGQWIGGPGVRLTVSPTAGSMECVTFGDGCRNPPHGVLGGTPGIGGGQYVDTPSTGKRIFVSASGNIRIDRGQSWVGVSTGGGGYGNPIARDAEQVRRDVRDGLISRDRARLVFGVGLFGDVNETLDEAETRRLRDELRTVERPMVDPVGPAASLWLDENMRDGDEYLLNPL